VRRDAFVLIYSAWLLLCGHSVQLHAADVSPTVKGGEWTVDNLDGSEGIWHRYSSTLIPQNTPGAVESSSPSAQTSPSDSAEYFIDSKPPRIKRVQPSGKRLDPENPQIIYEIDDGKQGSGLYYFGGSNQSVTVDVKSPVPVGKTFSIIEDEEVMKIRVVITVDKYLLEDESYDVSITAVDRVGNTETQSESISAEVYEPSFQLNEKIKLDSGFKSNGSNSCRYSFPIDLITTINAEESGGAIVTGKPGGLKITASLIGTALKKTALDKVRVRIDGPADHRIIPGSGKSEKVIALTAEKGARNGDKVRVTITYPDEGEGGFGFNGGLPKEDTEFYSNEISKALEDSANHCRTIVVSERLERCEEGEDRVGIGSLCAFRYGSPLFSENGSSFNPNDYAKLTGSEDRTTLEFTIIEKLPVPEGEFDYDADKKELTYTIKSEGELRLDEGRSRSVLGSNVGYSSSKRMERKDDTYKFIFSNVTEGSYSIQAGLFGYGFFDVDGEKSSIYVLDDEYEVKEDPPQVSQFRYDYSTNTFSIQVNDIGTPPELLTGILKISDKAYEVTFNESGQASFLYPQPLESETVTFSVADLSRQFTPQSLGLLGRKALQESGVKAESISVSEGVGTGSRGYIGQGKIVNGKQSFVKCRPPRRPRPNPESRITTSPNNRSSPPPSRIAGVRTSRFSPITRGSTGCAGEGYGCSVNARRNNSAYRPNSGGSGGAVVNCSPPRFLDRFSPVISDFTVDVQGSSFTAVIDDHGGPLDEVKVSYQVYEGVRRRLLKKSTDAGTDGDYDLAGSVDAGFIMGAESEILEVWLTARDKSRNSSSEKRRLIVPRFPPEIQLRHVPVRDGAGSTLLFAELSDQSGIDLPLTSLSINDTPCSAILLEEGRSGEKDFKKGKSKWVCRVQLGEGEHVFAARGTDRIGLLAERELAFSIQYKPEITNFVLNTVNPGQPGAEVFSATVHDLGNNVVVEGMQLAVNGSNVPHSQLEYDPQSGQISVLGPIDIEPGTHVAELTVTDNTGNSDSKRLTFGYTSEVLSEFDESLQNLQLERLSIWELQGANGDGVINPGELVKVFPVLTNFGLTELSGLSVSLSSSTLGVNIESPEGLISALPVQQSASVLEGFDVRISEDMLSREGVRELAIPLQVRVNDSAGSEWQFTSTLNIREARETFTNAPVIEPGVVVNILPTLTLNTPPSITPPQFDVGGEVVTYTGSFDLGDSELASLTVSVDGNAPVEIAGIFNSAPGIPVLGLPGGGLGLGQSIQGSVNGNSFTFSALLGSGNHIVIFTLETEDGDITAATDGFTL